MKKILSILLSVITLFSVLSLAGCGEKTLQVGFGSYIYRDNIKNATAEKDGTSDTTVTIAAVLLDSNGKILDCAIDSIDIDVKFTQKGEAVTLGELKSKYELGDSYGMKVYGNAKDEWYKEVDSFIGVAKGKNVKDISKLVDSDKKGNDEVVKAGCTIEVAEFVKAIQNAANSATEIKAKDDSKVKVAFSAEKTKETNATDEKDGQITVDVSFAATLLSKDNKVIKPFVDSVDVDVKFDNKGVNKSDDKSAMTKKTAGTGYGMAQYGTDLNKDGKVLEWYLQVEALEKFISGKTSGEIDKLVAKDGYGNEELQKAGCTIKISNLTKAASKACKTK